MGTDIRANPLWGFLALTSLMILIASCGPKVPQVTVRMPVLRAQLDNGIRLILIPDPEATNVEVHARYQVGASSDPRGKAGLARLLEYALFQREAGSYRGEDSEEQPTYEGQPTKHVAPAMESYTTWEQIHTLRRGSIDQLPAMLEAEALRLYRGCKLVHPVRLEVAQKILARRRDALEPNPTVSRREALANVFFPADHPYRRPVEGIAEELLSVTRDELCSFTDRHLVPANLILVVTGNLEPDPLGRLVNGWFGRFPKKPRPPAPVLPEIETKARQATIAGTPDDRGLHILWPLPPHFTDQYDYASIMLVAIQRTWPRLLARRSSCSVTEMVELGGKHGSALDVGLSLAEGAEVQECLNSVWEAVSQTHWFLAGSDLSQKNNRWLAKLSFLEGMDSASGKADFVADGAQFDRRVDYTAEDGNCFLDYIDRIEAISYSDFRQFVEDSLQARNATIVSVGGSGPEARRPKEGSDELHD